MRHANKAEYATESRRETSTRHANKTEHATGSGRETSVSFESRNPATGELLGTYPAHNKIEIEVRLQRAWDGWRLWYRTPLHERIAFLTQVAELLEERVDTFSDTITAE